MNRFAAAILSGLCLSFGASQAFGDEVITQSEGDNPPIAQEDIDRAYMIGYIVSAWRDQIVQRGGSPSQLEITLSDATDSQLIALSEAQSLEEINDLLR